MPGPSDQLQEMAARLKAFGVMMRLGHDLFNAPDFQTAAVMAVNNARPVVGFRSSTLLQIRGRTLTPGEEKYARAWLDMGFDEGALKLAYERTCLNTGGLSWAYMNKILTRWQAAGLFTVEQIQNGDKKPVPKGASGQLGQAEMDAIAKLLRED